MSGVVALVAILAAASSFGFVPPASAANGDHLATVHFAQTCGSGIGVGIAFDGAALWFSCYASSPDLIRADPATGATLASYNIRNGLGALSYDATRNAIWAGYARGSNSPGDVVRIDLDASKVPTATTHVFNAGGGCGIDDGLAFDARNVADPLDDVFYYNDDCGGNIAVFSMSGVLLETFDHFNCHNSGVGVGGQFVYLVDNCPGGVTRVVEKVTKVEQFTFSTIVAGDPNFRTEDLECDTVTFAGTGQHVMWGVEAYEPRRAHAFEIPFGTCGTGGRPADPDVDGWMTGGGSVFTSAGARVTHGFTLQCIAASEAPSSLQVNWGGNRFHMTSLDSASCSDDGDIDSGSPEAGFDTHTGTGSGRLNGVDGAKATWTFTDAGEPGAADGATLTIEDSGGAVVLSVSGLLARGNHQAHAAQEG